MNISNLSNILWLKNHDAYIASRLREASAAGQSEARSPASRQRSCRTGCGSENPMSKKRKRADREPPGPPKQGVNLY